ncbi:glycosyltransferase [Paenibacillus sp. SYP-B4298]|uniref:glycosyltransferase n=1 Tax=Paenibacillus sp. SYP-B4298 TaxID=2996034 RepID=UPI0022DD7283|nr:nucleotide disphospho-sugar-binding domain-containing protein [Paenibacillus sp. SYP-B4298]
MAHIIMLTIGSGGDLYPFFRMGSVLQQHGHRVTLVTHCIYEQESMKRGFAFMPFDTTAQYQLMMNADIQVQVQNPASGIDFTRKYLLPRMEDNARRIAELYDGAETLLIGHYMIHVLAQMIAERLRIPYVTVFLAPSFLEGAQTSSTMSRYFGQEINGIRQRFELAPVRNWERLMEDYSHGVAFWPHWFGDTAERERITKAGFLLHENEEEIPAAYRSQIVEERPVLITHATTPPISPAFFQASIEACETLGLPAIVVTRHVDVVPQRLPAGILHVDRLPFSKIMPSVRLLIHHGGIGTLGQALQAGIPQLILGNGFDRPRNAGYVSGLGAGGYLPISRWNKDDVSAAIQQLLDQPQVQEACQVASCRMRDSDPDKLVVDIVARALEGTPTRSGELQYGEPQQTTDSLHETIELLQGLTPEHRRQLMAKLVARKAKA